MPVENIFLSDRHISKIINKLHAAKDSVIEAGVDKLSANIILCHQFSGIHDFLNMIKEPEKADLFFDEIKKLLPPGTEIIVGKDGGKK